MRSPSLAWPHVDLVNCRAPFLVVEG